MNMTMAANNTLNESLYATKGKGHSRGKSLANKTMTQGMKKSSPKKKRYDSKAPHKVVNHVDHHNLGNDLLTPTSISMKNAFIIKNAD